MFSPSQTRRHSSRRKEEGREGRRSRSSPSSGDGESLGSRKTKETVDGGVVTVSAEGLQITFENLKCVINSTEEEVLTKESVLEMLDSTYRWMVFDKNMQIVVPSAPGSKNKQKMWPHGCTIDTRRRERPDTHRDDPRQLRRITEEEASTVASSVVSSALEEDRGKQKKNSVVYQSPQQHQPAYYSPHTPPYAEEPRPLFHDMSKPQYQPPAAQQSYPFGYGGGHSSLAYRPAVPKTAARYSMVMGPVSPPVPVPDTPISSYREPVGTKKKKAKVGAAPRQGDVEASGDAVVFAE